MKSRLMLLIVILVIIAANFSLYITSKAAMAELACYFDECSTIDRIYREVPENTASDITDALIDISYYELGKQIVPKPDFADEDVFDAAIDYAFQIGVVQSVIYPLLPIVLYIVWRRSKTNRVDPIETTQTEPPYRL